VVGKCTSCSGDGILLTTDGLAALSPGMIAWGPEVVMDG